MLRQVEKNFLKAEKKHLKKQVCQGNLTILKYFYKTGDAF